MSLLDVNLDCLREVLGLLSYYDIHTLSETSRAMRSRIVRALGGLPAMMLTIKNSAFCAEVDYHATGKSLIFSQVEPDDEFHDVAIYDKVNLVFSWREDVEGMMAEFRKLVSHHNGHRFLRFKQLNVYIHKNAYLPKDVFAELLEFDFHIFSCSAIEIAPGIELPMVLNACRRASYIWIQSPDLQQDLTTDLATFDPFGYADLYMLLQYPEDVRNPAVPADAIGKLIEIYQSKKLFLSVSVHEYPGFEESFQAMLSHVKGDFNIKLHNGQISIYNTDNNPFGMFMANSSALTTSSTIFPSVDRST
uniref:F-box domain-containing protein n=1 Tax=Panagrellus redivivus TaxID=6233 RepID=A0A7E4VZV7_PANRE